MQTKLYITDKTQIQITFRNPMFSNQGTASLPLQLPGANAQKLLYPHNLNKRAKTSFAADINFAGTNLFRGKLEIEETTNNDIQGFFASGKGEFASLIKDKYLTDIDDYEIISNVGQGIDTIGNISQYVDQYPTRNLVFFPVYMPNYPEANDLDANFKVLNDWDAVNQQFREPSGLNFMMPQFAPSYFLCYVVKTIFSKAGYSIVENCLFDNFRQLVIFNYNPHKFFPGIEYRASFSADLPHMLISDFIKSIENLLCCTFFINDKLKQVNIMLKKDLVLSSKYFADYTNKVYKPKSINHASVIKGVTLKAENSGITIKTDVTIFDTFNELSDINYTPQIGDKFYITTENTIYSFDKTEEHPTGEYVKYTYYYIDYSEGDASLAFETKAGTLSTKEMSSPDYNLIPECEAERKIFFPPAALPSVQPNKNEGLALLWYYGLMDNVLNPDIDYVVDTTTERDEIANPVYGDLCYVRANKTVYDFTTEWHSNPMSAYISYPFASGYNYYLDAVEGYIPTTQSMSWHGTYGLVNQYWKHFLYYLQNIYREITVGLNLTVVDLQNIDFSKKIRINNRNYFIKEIPVTFKGKSIKVGEVTLIEA